MLPFEPGRLDYDVHGITGERRQEHKQKYELFVDRPPLKIS